MSRPAPTATSLTAASRGLSRSAIARTTLWTPWVSIRFLASGAGSTAESTVRSTPEQKASPAPVTTTTRTSSSAAARRSPSAQSSIIARVNAFLCSGRFSVIVATACPTRYRGFRSVISPELHPRIGRAWRRWQVSGGRASDQHHQPRRHDRGHSPARSEPVRTGAPRAPSRDRSRKPNRQPTRNRTIAQSVTGPQER
jgi:hypothetical protein